MFPNFGVYGHSIQTTGTYVAGFPSSNHANENQRPKLTIVYITATHVNYNDQSKPHTVILQQNYPNPFNVGTTIFFTLLEFSSVTLKILDV